MRGSRGRSEHQQGAPEAGLGPERGSEGKSLERRGVQGGKCNLKVSGSCGHLHLQDDPVLASQGQGASAREACSQLSVACYKGSRGGLQLPGVPVLVRAVFP